VEARHDHLFFISHFIQSYKIICLMGTKLAVLTTPTTALLAPSYSTITTLKLCDIALEKYSIYLAGEDERLPRLW
jgi:hypothetical protein